MKPKILIVEDQFIEAKSLNVILTNAGYSTCSIARSVTAALSIIEKENADLVLVDIFLQGEGTGIDLGTLLNEKNMAFVYLSANSNRQILVKYAFTKMNDRKISISLNHISDSQTMLSIADNGRGLPVDFDQKIGTSMGMELLQGLTDDLGSSFSIETNNRTHIKIIFGSKPVTAVNI